MESKAVNLLRFFQIGKQCLIPIYQRTYSWSEEQCDLLWSDIVRIGKNDLIPSHFVGSFVYIQEGPNQVFAATPQCMVIDGQQRMTTISLLLLALADAIQKNGCDLQFDTETKVSATYIKNNYLLNSNEDGNRKFKLILTQSDKDTYLNLLEGNPIPELFSKRIIENYEFFQDKLAESDLVTVYRGIQKLMIVEIALDRTIDNPQLIFESLNSTGLELSQADLIRNFILMGLERERQDEVYKKYWFPMEGRFGHAEYSSYFDRFMRDYLTIKLGRIPNIDDVHKEFKFYSQALVGQDISDVVSDVFKYSEYYVKMVLGKETDQVLKLNFENLNQLRVDVAYPFLLQVYEDFVGGVIGRDDFVKVIQLIESYVFRRSICGIQTNSLNKTFSLLYRDLDKQNYVESIQSSLLLKDSYRRFPNDFEFQEAISIKDVYNFRNKNYLFKKLESSKLQNESINFDKLSIEHILPQNPNLSSHWISDLGSNYQEVQEKYLHTLGNLTLTGYNSELSDRPFVDKREAEGGFRNSRLYLNSGLRDLEVWNESEIQKRAEQLSQLALTVWSYPKLDDSVVQRYKKHKTKKKEDAEYTLDHYKHLNDFRLDLYKKLSERISAIHPDITEQFNKQYIAFRNPDELNFICIVPQKSRLRITLSIRLEDLNDVKGICEDVSGLGYWGTGVTLFGIKSESELDYSMNLILQSYEDSMSD